jgi:transposase
MLRTYNGEAMFRRRNGTPTELEAAVAVLLQTQARFVSHLDEDRQRFARIERELEAIKALLMKHEQMILKLTDAVRDRIGFKQ